MLEHRPWLLMAIAACVACASAPVERPGPGDPCGTATSMRSDALRQLEGATQCETDADCVVISTEVECANVQLGDCGTLVNRAAQSTLDWARVEREICNAVEGSDFGCSVNVSCAALAAPHCESGLCTQHPDAQL